MTSVFACLTPKTEESRDILLKNLMSAATVAELDEPDTVKYLIALPHDVDSADPESIYVIEEYLSGAGFELHCKQKSVEDVIQTVRDGALKQNSLSLKLEVDHDFDFIGPGLAQTSDPFVVVVQLLLKPGTGGEALSKLKTVVEASRRDSEMLGFASYPDPKEPDVIRFMGIYKTRDYYFNIHVRSKEVQEFQIATNHIMVEQKAHFLKPIGGFLYRFVDSF